MGADPVHPYVSRGGLKLRHALEEFRIEVTGLRCADLGASVGGFTDCLLQAGAAHVVAVDTAYGQFAWKLRNDPRVKLLERTNALHAEPVERVDLVVIDLGWTPQRLAVAAGFRWLRSPPPGPLPEGGGEGKLITLIKPHYELEPDEARRLLHDGVLEESEAQRVVERVVAALPALGARVEALTRSPIAGSKEKSRGNAEWLALLTPRA